MKYMVFSFPQIPGLILSQMSYNLRERVARAGARPDDTDSDISSEEDDNYVVTDDSEGSFDEASSESSNGEEEIAEAEEMEVEQEGEMRGFTIVRGRGDMRGRDDTVWSQTPRARQGRPLARNLIVALPGPRQEARNGRSVLEMWQCLINDDIVDAIVRYTNMEIERKRPRYQGQRYVGNTDSVELKALFGLLYLAGLQKSGKRKAEELFDSKWSGEMYRCTMSLKRFQFLLICIRFDDRDTRVQRRNGEQGRMAPIYDFFTNVNENCKTFYSPSGEVTVDEQLYPFRGRCAFRVYIPNKPDKYGIEVVSMCDARTFYRCNAILYTGKGSTPAGIPQAEYFVRTLARPIERSNRNITMDNRFSSIVLFEGLRRLGLTALGTVRKNRRELPPRMLDLQQRDFHSALFATHNDITLLSLCPPKKPKRVVVLMSSMHTTWETEQEAARLQKPEIVRRYNKTKGGVDTHDQLCHAYSVIRPTRRWPLVVFYGTLDTVGVNSVVLYRMVTGRNESRRIVLQNLVEGLIYPHMRRRLEQNQTPRLTKNNIRNILGIQLEPAPRVQNDGSRARCGDCPRRLDRKTKDICARCRKPICAQHTTKACVECIE